jgi:hypothetical protein
MESAILVLFTPKGESVNRFPYVWPSEEILRGRRFSSDAAFADAIQNWLKPQLKKPLFMMELKTYETLEPVRRNRGAGSYVKK